MSESRQSVSYTGRTNADITSDKIESLIRLLTCITDDHFRTYPEVIGGVIVSYQNFQYERHTIHTFSTFVEVLKSGRALDVRVEGKAVDATIDFNFIYDILKNTSVLELTLQTVDMESGNYKREVLEAYKKLFPLEPYTYIDKFLLQRGFQFKTAPKRFYLPNYRELKSTKNRQKLKTMLGADKYGYEFEKYCASLAENELFWETRLNVKLLDEGSGGDYDVLALSNASNDLIYIEAKTGHQLDGNDFKNVLDRHNFLRPAFTVIVVDLSRQYVSAKKDVFLNAMGADYEPGHAPAVEDMQHGRSFILNAHRNIFLVSNEDIQQALSLCMRQYDGVIRQTSYYS